MSTTESRIDISRLEKIKRRGDRIEAQCPACAAQGGDKRGQHLVVFDDGRFACAAHPGDSEHRKEVSQLVGVVGEGGPRDQREEQEWRARRAKEERQRNQRSVLSGAATRFRSDIVRRFQWERVDVWEDSPIRIDCDLVARDPRYFLRALFPDDATVWTGQPRHSGQGEGHHWKPVKEWLECQPEEVGPMTSPATWPIGIESRSGRNVLTSPYTVLDFDELPGGKKPETTEEKERLVLDALAITRWLRDQQAAELAAIVSTGNRSIHVWIRTPDAAALESLRSVSEALGIDDGLLGHPEHPCRLPGQPHAKTGKLSAALWITANPTASR